MKKIITIFFFLLMFVSTQFSVAQSKIIPTPTPAQQIWQEAELAVVYHYDLHVFDGKKYNQAYNRITPIADINIFNPEHLDTDQWIRSAKDMGAKIVIIIII